jgi:hypothetical protein
MRRNCYLKLVIGAIIACATAGGWLVVDLLLPDPVGDYILYPLMAVTNIVIGWQVGKIFRKQRDDGKSDVRISGERNEAKFELKS